MSFTDWVAKLEDRSLGDSFGELVVGYRRRTNWLEKRATNVFDRKWDVLIICDGCRHDVMCQVAPEYSWISLNKGDKTTGIWSVGGTSEKWLENTFGSTHETILRETAYITANPFSDTCESLEQIGYLEEVWRYGWNEEKGTVLPERMVQETLDYIYEDSTTTDRIIVHLMQPHEPFIGNSHSIGRQLTPDTWGKRDDTPVWQLLSDADEEYLKRFWKAYAANLRRALDSISELRERIDGLIVVSADHGNAMGELGQYGHGANKLVKSNCYVPWIETEGEGKFTPYEPTSLADTDASKSNLSVEDRLNALGYK